METIGYEEARKRVRTGDVVAFGGTGLLSRIIKAAGKTVVSHAGVIFAPLSGEKEPQFIESTVRLDGADPTWRVQTTCFEARWEEYSGEVWVLPLAPGIRDEHFDEKKFCDFLESAIGKVFDIPEGLRIIIKEMLESLQDQALVEEDYYFCSELVAEAFIQAGTVSDVDSEDVSPKDLCRWKMYEDTYYLREGKGKVRRIEKYNTLPPGSTS
jgi:hypothetical protein